MINSLNVGAGDTIVMFGAGGVGLSAVMAAKLVGAARIIAMDVVPARLALAKELGATDVINSKDMPEVAKAIRELVPGGVSLQLQHDTSARDLHAGAGVPGDARDGGFRHRTARRMEAAHVSRCSPADADYKAFSAGTPRLNCSSRC